MNRLKSISPSRPVGPSQNTEPPTEPGIWTKLLPDGRTVPWIVLPPAEPNDMETLTGDASARASRGCYKCTS